jgi:hypothetical protein
MRIIALLILFFCSYLCPAQELSYAQHEPLDADLFVGFDSYKNIFFVKDMALYKQGPEGNFSFNDFQLGNISSVDIINPLKIAVYYKDVNSLVFLDNRLSEIERFSIENSQEFINVSAATNAGNNRLWIFNVDSQQLELYDYRSQRKTIVSQPFPGKLLSQRSNFNYCFTLTENKLRTFNIYGSLISEIDIEGFTKIVQQNENIIALKENDLFYLSPLTDESVIKQMNGLNFNSTEITIKDLQLTQDLLYIYDGNSLYTFTITQPKK